MDDVICYTEMELKDIHMHDGAIALAGGSAQQSGSLHEVLCECCNIKTWQLISEHASLDCLDKNGLLVIKHAGLSAWCK